MADNTTLNSGSSGDILRTEDIGGGIKIPVSKIYLGLSGFDGGPVTATNPFPVSIQSGSLSALLVGGQGSSPVSRSNPLPITGSVGLTVAGVGISQANPIPTSGTIGILISGNPIATTNPLPVSGSVGLTMGGAVISFGNSLPVSISLAGSGLSRSSALPIESTSEASGQVISGSIMAVVNRFNIDVVGSGSTQVLPAQGAGNIIRVLAVSAISNGTVMTKWQSTGSSGKTNISAYVPLTTLGGFLLPHNPHGWFQTNANEALNISLDTPGVNVGITLTWARA